MSPLPPGTDRQATEQVMQPEGAGGGEDGCEDQGSPPAAGHRGRDREAPSHSPLPDLSSSEIEEDEQQQPAASIPEDALVEILLRVPYRSLRRFKCVSKDWLALCSATDIRRRSPQTLSGFFHFRDDGNGRRLRFRNLSGRGPPMVDTYLPFLRDRYNLVTFDKCCSSLLLCQCWKSSPEGHKCCEIVCNPATENWTVLPPIVLPGREDRSLFNLEIYLGFDMADPSRFVVFVPLGSSFAEPAEVAIYSSDTGRWTSVQSEWGDKSILAGNQQCVFLNRTMHLTTFDSSVVTVDAEGKVWRKIKMPNLSICDRSITSIGQSQGRLYAWQMDNHCDSQLYVWVLEDYDTGKWTLKHTVNFLELFGRHRREDTESYKMFAIHPERNVLFLTDGKQMTVSYDMDNQKVHVICTAGEFLGGLPYTPCFAD